MAREREIKLRIEDLPALRRALAKVAAVVVTLRVHERNMVFDTPKLTLTKREQLLRIRTESPTGRGRAIRSRNLVTFKRTTVAAGSSVRGERHKVREETELEVTDAKALARIFERLGMRGGVEYVKFRTTCRLPGSRAWANRLLIELDETPIGG